MLGTSLKKVEKPVFALDPYFDLVITERGIIATNQRFFETLFKESEAILENVPAWVESITDHLPIAGDGAAALAEKCRSDSRLRRRLRAVADRGHLQNVTLDQIRAHLEQLELPEDCFIVEDELVFDDADPFTLMALLNEDLFSGGLTGTGFRSERKSTR
jgi:antitoxin component HigA of HigAB toxin-antitoxin module